MNIGPDKHLLWAYFGFITTLKNIEVEAAKIENGFSFFPEETSATRENAMESFQTSASIVLFNTAVVSVFFIIVFYV